MTTDALYCWTRYQAEKAGLPAVDGRIAAAIGIHARKVSGSDERGWRAADLAIHELMAIQRHVVAMERRAAQS